MEYNEDLTPPAADYKTDVKYLLEDVKVEKLSEVNESHFKESDRKIFIKDEYQPQEILCDSIKEENGFLQCEKINHMIKKENSTVATEVKFYSSEQEINATQFNVSPHSYHFLLKQETKSLAAEVKIKEEKPFFFRDSLKVKQEAGNFESNNGPSLDFPSPKKIHDHIENSHQVEYASQRIHPGPALSVCLKSIVYEVEEEGSKVTSRKKNIYFCKVCNKEFTSISKLVVHERVHAGERPYSCKVCNKAFNRKQKLVIHERIHTGERPFSCRVCNKAFTSSSNLVEHERIHTGERRFSCEICNKSFTNKSSLVRHERVHTGERPFSCKVCNKAFTSSSNLVEHERIHTGERPFSCKVCNKAFTRKGGLVIHERIHIFKGDEIRKTTFEVYEMFNSSEMHTM